MSTHHPPPADLPRRTVCFLVSLLLCAGFAWRYRHLVQDDAFILFRHVRNALAGHGLVWNPGEPVEGHSSLLWAVALYVLGTTGIDLLVAARLLGLVCVSATLVLLCSARDGRLTWIAPLLALWPPFTAWAMTGMETSAVVLAMVSLVLVAEPHGQRAVVSGWSLGLVGCVLWLLRPDGVLPFATALLLLCWIRVRHRWPLVGLIQATALFCVVVALVTWWRWKTYGDVVPNTVRAKGEIGWYELQFGLFVYTARFAMTHLVPLVAWGWLVWCRRAAPWPEPLLFALLLVEAVYVSLVGGDFMPAYRFYVPVLPLALMLLLPVLNCAEQGGYWWVACLVLAFTGIVVWEAPPAGQLLVWSAAAAVLLVAGLFASRWRAGIAGAGLGLLLLARGLYATPTEPDQAWYFGRIIADAVRERWPPQTLVALAPCGAFPHVTGFPCIDTLGLCDRHIARRKVRGLPVPRHVGPGHMKGDGAYVLDRRPDVIFLGSSMGVEHPRAARVSFRSDLEIMADPRFRAAYLPVRLVIDTRGERFHTAYLDEVQRRLSLIYFLRRDHKEDARYTGERLSFGD